MFSDIILKVVSPVTTAVIKRSIFSGINESVQNGRGILQNGNEILRDFKEVMTKIKTKVDSTSASVEEESRVLSREVHQMIARIDSALSDMCTVSKQEILKLSSEAIKLIITVEKTVKNFDESILDSS
jgi:hypothetical protein